MIISFSYNYIWTTEGPQPTDHFPYFIIKDDGRDIPVLGGRDIQKIGDPFYLESWVNWEKVVKVRRIYVSHPSTTPFVSTEYFKASFETYENAVPYLNRVAADLEAQGKFPLDTKGEWVELNCLLYDIEDIKDKDLLACIGFGIFKIKIKSSIDRDKKHFEMEVEIPETCEIEQVYSNYPSDEKILLRSFVEKCEQAHIIIGHNITVYDNWEIYQRLKKYGEFSEFLSKRTSLHTGFFRGRKEEHVVEIWPMSFDTLLAARFLFKNLSDVGYGLKRLAPELGVSFPGRTLERDFGGFGNWNSDNPVCLKYNADDVRENYGVFVKECKAILINMLITGMSFQDVVAGSNGRMADHLSLMRGSKNEINPPMMHPSLAANGLWAHFGGELKTKKDIFEFFIKHWSEAPDDTFSCTDECVAKLPKGGENGDTMTAKHMTDKLMRVVKYGEEMPEWVTYYPFLVSLKPKVEPYIAVGGRVDKPPIVLTPFHNCWKADASAQYPTILKALNITSDVVRLARRGETPTGWCWFRTIYNQSILELFEWQPASNFKFSDGEGYFIGYISRGREGLLSESLTGIIEAVGEYKRKPGWEEAYQKALKPMRNSLTHGVLLSLHSTCQQFNLAGCAIPTVGQEIADNMIKYLQDNKWLLLEGDTDGSEFISLDPNSKPFEEYVAKIEQYWQKRLGYPIVFDVEHADHKLYLAHKNYITIEKGKIKLTGATLKSNDRPKIAEEIMKALMLDVLPRTNTRAEFIAGVYSNTRKHVNEAFSKPDFINRLVMVQSIAPPSTYEEGNRKQRSIAMETLIGRSITFPTKMEFYVCKERLPLVDGEKTEAEPIPFMWPVTNVESDNKTIDIEWYKDMVYAYVDTAFGFSKTSSKDGARSVSSFFEGVTIGADESDNIEKLMDNVTIRPRREVKKQEKLW